MYPGLDLQPPAASSLGGALEELLGQALAFEFPAHPNFGAEIKSSNLRKVYDEVLKATSEKEGRLLVEKTNRSLVKQIAEPLNLGEQGETHFLLWQRWRDHFTRKASESGSTMDVAALRKWIDEPRPMGLLKECGNLIILIFAAQTNRSFFRHNAPFDATLTNLPDEVELREQQLPPETQWLTAVERAGRIFGAVSSPLLNANNLARLAQEFQSIVTKYLDSCGTLTRTLQKCLNDFGVRPEDAPRYQTAGKVAEFLERARSAKPADVVKALADLQPQTSEAAMGSSMTSAEVVLAALKTTQWKLFDSIQLIEDDRMDAAQSILGRVRDALSSDQHVIDLCPVLKVEQSKAIDLLAPRTGADRKDPGTQTKTEGAGSKTGGRREEGSIKAAPRQRLLHVGSDEADLLAHYGSDQAAIDRNRALVERLKKLYGKSQVEGDRLPDALPAERIQDALEVHHIKALSKGGPDECSNMIVVTASLHNLIHADPGCLIDLKAGKMVLFGVPLRVDVHASHNG
jgi:hypothetical protein